MKNYTFHPCSSGEQSQIRSGGTALYQRAAAASPPTLLGPNDHVLARPLLPAAAEPADLPGHDALAPQVPLLRLLGPEAREPGLLRVQRRLVAAHARGVRRARVAGPRPPRAARRGARAHGGVPRRGRRAPARARDRHLKAELTAAKACVPLAPFLSAVQPIRDPGSLPYRLAAYVVGRPLWWALQQAGVVASDESFGAAGDAERWRRAKGDYVVVDLVERAADAVVAGQEARGGVNVADAVYSFEGFKKTFASEAIEGVTLSDLDLKVLLKYLERDKKVIVRQGDVIKFTQGAATPEITAVDIGVLELKTAIENLEAAIEHIHKQIDDRTAKASAALTQKRKETALSHLRARKQYEDLLAKRLAALDTLHGTLLAVERAAGDVALLHAYAGSTATLRGILAHPALRLERLDATTDAMAAAQADARDIDERIRLGADLALADAGVDDAELESELSALVAEAEGEKAAKVKAEEEEMLRRMEALKTPSHTPPAEAQEEQAKVPEHA